MEIYVNGSKITLTQNNFVAKGGEGKVFKRGNIAYKVYEDLSKMIPLAKIKELQTLNDPHILGPKEIILNKKKQTIGFTMDWLDDVIALVKLFTNTFREANSIENDMVIQLVENMKKMNHFVHTKNCLIVDGNELNYLVSNDFITPYLIDVNSLQTPSYGPTAIMASIRDWSSEKFTPLTDWFSFGVVAFQLFIGIHPFKGTHPKYRKNDFVNRVKDSVSVFNSAVSLPPTARDFNLIPSAYKDWFYKMFENGDRLPPPALPGEAGKVQVTIKLIQSTGSFEITSLFEVDDKIIYHNPESNITRTQEKIFINKVGHKVSKGVEMLFTPLEKLPILVKINKGMVDFKCLTQNYVMKDITLAASDIMIIDNVLYLKNRGKLIEMDFAVMGQLIIPTIKIVWNIEELSSTLFSNVVYQSVLGKAHLCIPQPNHSGSGAFHIKAIPELDDHRIIEAKYQNKVCMAITHYKNEYHRFVIVFDPKFSKYTYRVINGVDYIPLNFVVLDNGLCVNITEDNAIEMFLNRIDKTDVKRIEDPDIDNTMRLCKDGNIVKFHKDNKVYSMKMK